MLQIGVVEEAVHAPIEAEVLHAVDPLEIVGVEQRLAHARVGELLAARVEHDGRRHRRDVAALGQFEDEVAVVAGRKVHVGCRPILGDAFAAEGDDAFLGGFPRHGVVAEVLEDDALVVVLAAHARHVPAPVVVDALVHDAAAELEVGDAVGAAAEGRFDGGLGDVALRPVVGGEDRQVADAQTRGGIAERGIRDVDRHFAVAHLLGASEVPEPGADRRRCVVYDEVDGVENVRRGHRHAVVPAGVRVDAHLEPAVVRRGFEFAESRVLCGRVVVARFQDAVEEIDARADEAVARGVDAFLYPRREAVERADHRQHEFAADGRIRVDVVEVRVVRWVLQFAEEREAVVVAGTGGVVGRLLAGRIGRGGRMRRRAQQCDAADAPPPTGLCHRSYPPALNGHNGCGFPPVRRRVPRVPSIAHAPSPRRWTGCWRCWRADHRAAR